MQAREAMALAGAIQAHYGGGDLVEHILAALGAMGRETERIDARDLGAVGEFHIGGAEATAWLIDRLMVGTESHVLDVGSGIGGTARAVTLATGARVTGIDLSRAYVSTARELTRRTRLPGLHFVQGSATALPFAEASFDAASMLHVGMNLPDKSRLCGEVARVVKPGGRVVVYDIMLTGGGQPRYPTPWASGPEISFVAAPDAYAAAALDAGFSEVRRRDRRAFALDVFDRQEAELAASGPPPLGLHLVMGDTARVKYGNMVAAVRAGCIAPVEMVFRRDR